MVTCEDNDFRKELLNDILHSFLKKDIREAGIKYEDKFYNFLKLLSSQVGYLVNKNEHSRVIGISQTAIDNYLYILKKTFYISLTPPFFTRVSKEITKMPKVYFFDTGFRNIVLKNFTEMEVRADKGSLLENVVFKYFSEVQHLEDIKFWRRKSGVEIDFVVNDEAYEVKYSLSTLKKQQLQSFKAFHPGIDLSVLFYRGKSAKTNYRYIPEFLLKNE